MKTKRRVYPVDVSKETNLSQWKQCATDVEMSWALPQKVYKQSQADRRMQPSVGEEEKMNVMTTVWSLQERNLKHTSYTSFDDSVSPYVCIPTSSNTTKQT